MPTRMPSHAIHCVAPICLLSPNTWYFHLYLYAPVVQIPVMSKKNLRTSNFSAIVILVIALPALLTFTCLFVF